MDTAGLIDRVIRYADNVDPADADNTARRARWLQAAQEVFDTVWNRHDWRFKMTGATVTVANNVGVLPADFQEFGEHGGVFVTGTDIRLTEVPEQTIFNGVAAGLQVWDGAFAWGNNSPTTGIPNIYVRNHTSLKVWYVRTPPTLIDTTGATSLLQTIPPAYHNTVLLPGTVAKSRKAKGDDRDWSSAYERGLADMIMRERRQKTAVMQMPKAISGKW